MSRIGSRERRGVANPDLRRGDDGAALQDDALVAVAHVDRVQVVGAISLTSCSSSQTSIGLGGPMIRWCADAVAVRFFCFVFAKLRSC